MPCVDEHRFENEARREEESRELRRVSAMLCAVFSAIHPTSFESLLSMIDENRSGVSRTEIRQWWARHQRRDSAAAPADHLAGREGRG